MTQDPLNCSQVGDSWVEAAVLTLWRNTNGVKKQNKLQLHTHKLIFDFNRPYNSAHSQSLFNCSLHSDAAPPAVPSEHFSVAKGSIKAWSHDMMLSLITSRLHPNRCTLDFSQVVASKKKLSHLARFTVVLYVSDTPVTVCVCGWSASLQDLGVSATVWHHSSGFVPLSLSGVQTTTNYWLIIIIFRGVASALWQPCTIMPTCSEAQPNRRSRGCRSVLVSGPTALPST